MKRKKPEEPIISNTNNSAISVVSITTNPEINDVPKIKMKKKKNKRKQKKIE